MPQAIGRRTFLQGAADVVLAVNDDPPALVLDAFQEGRPLAELHVGPAVVRSLSTAAHRDNCLAIELLAIENIIERDRLRGKFVKCTIKSRKEDGQSLNLIAGCATDIMLSNVQFVLQVVDDDNIARVFPGVEGMVVKYHRCRL